MRRVELDDMTDSELQSKLESITQTIEGNQNEIDYLESENSVLEDDRWDIEQEIKRRDAENVEHEPAAPTREQQIAAGQLELPFDEVAP